MMVVMCWYIGMGWGVLVIGGYEVFEEREREREGDDRRGGPAVVGVGRDTRCRMEDYDVTNKISWMCATREL